MKRTAERLRKFAQWTRDWRVRVLVPVIAINVAAFAGLYWLMDRYAMANLVNTHKFGATMLLDQIEIDLRDLQIAHNRALLQQRLDAHQASRGLLAINVYNIDGQPIGSTHGLPDPRELAQVRLLMAQPEHPPIWVTGGEQPNLFGVRPLRNGPTCMTCHGSAPAILGAIQLGVDMTRPMADARARVNRNFTLAGLAWVSLLGLMFWTGGAVIGKPLRQMQSALKVASAETDDGRGHDLRALADKVHDTLWNLIRQQRQREDDIARHMARAEQLAALGQLAAGLTHEIKNPLAGVIAAMELLRSEDENDSQHEVYDQILAELRRVTGTVEALLRLAKPQPPQRTATDLSRVAREVTSLFAARLRRQAVTLELHASDALPMLPLDSGLIVQLLVNLLTNAMQATDRGGRIDVMVAPFPQGDGVVMAVADTGSGIDAEHLARIFDPFFTTKEEGTGLGMSICRQIVEQHGGTIEVESEVGRGTRVMVLLPDPEAAEGRVRHGAVAVG